MHILINNELFITFHSICVTAFGYVLHSSFHLHLPRTIFPIYEGRVRSMLLALVVWSGMMRLLALCFQCPGFAQIADHRLHQGEFNLQIQKSSGAELRSHQITPQKQTVFLLGCRVPLVLAQVLHPLITLRNWRLLIGFRYATLFLFIISKTFVGNFRISSSLHLKFYYNFSTSKWKHRLSGFYCCFFSPDQTDSKNWGKKLIHYKISLIPPCYSANFWKSIYFGWWNSVYW